MKLVIMLGYNSMKKILIGSVVLISWGNSFSQTVLIPIEKITPINILARVTKIQDTSGRFIKSSYELSQRFWKIHFTKIVHDENAKVLRLFGSAGLVPGKIDSFKMDNFDIHLCSLKNDTITNIKRLNQSDFFNKEDDFDVTIDLKTYNMIIFTSANRLPRIFDFSFLVH